jgi:hypothetical protein
MASKKKPSAEPVTTLDTVRLLTERARAELKELIAEEKAGTLNRIELETGLKKLKSRLKELALHEHKL